MLSDRKRIRLEKKSGFKGLPGRLAAYQAGSDQVAPGDQADQAAARPTRWHQAEGSGLAEGFSGRAFYYLGNQDIGQVATR